MSRIALELRMAVRHTLQLVNILWVIMKLTGQRKMPIRHWKKLSIAENRNVLHMKLMFLFLRRICVFYPGIMSKCGIQ